jgi:hypothetical protein
MRDEVLDDTRRGDHADARLVSPKPQLSAPTTMAKSACWLYYLATTRTSTLPPNSFAILAKVSLTDASSETSQPYPTA